MFCDKNRFAMVVYKTNTSFSTSRDYPEKVLVISTEFHFAKALINFQMTSICFSRQSDHKE